VADRVSGVGCVVWGRRWGLESALGSGVGLGGPSLTSILRSILRSIMGSILRSKIAPFWDDSQGLDDKRLNFQVKRLNLCRGCTKGI